MDLKLHCQPVRYDSQVAEDELPCIFFASLTTSGSFFLEPYHCSFDKGKPVEKRGRKAMDLKLHCQPVSHDSQVAESGSNNLLGQFERLYRKGDINGAQKSHPPNCSDCKSSPCNYHFHFLQPRLRFCFRER